MLCCRDLSGNNLSGPLPPSMAKLSSITTLWVFWPKKVHIWLFNIQNQQEFYIFFWKISVAIFRYTYSVSMTIVCINWKSACWIWVQKVTFLGVFDLQTLKWQSSYRCSWCVARSSAYIFVMLLPYFIMIFFFLNYAFLCI